MLAGVGFGGVLAHELAIQLAATSAEPPLALALLEAPHAARAPAALLPWLPEPARQEVCQAAAALYPAVAAAAGGDAPSFEAFVSRLASVAGPEEQLDYVASFKPAEVGGQGCLWFGRGADVQARCGYCLLGGRAARQGSCRARDCSSAVARGSQPLTDPSPAFPSSPAPCAARRLQESQAGWDARVTLLLSRLAYWQALAGAYTAADIFPGHTLLFARPRGGAAAGGADGLLAAGGPSGAWRSIALLVQPVEVRLMPEVAAGGSAGAAAAARALQAELLAAVAEQAEVEAASPEETAAEQGSSMLLTPRAPASPAQPFSPAVASDTVSVVLPLNRLCPERRYILRRSGGVGGTPAALRTPPLARLPLWLVHGETGSITGALKDLAASLPLPCYGLAMGGAAIGCASLAELAEHYAAAVRAVQPQGPYLLAGCSVSGAAVAHAVAARLQADGARAALLLLDGCLCQPAGLSLHDTTW